MLTVKFFGYNAFIIEDETVRILIDPGKNLKWNKLNSLIPKNLWSDADIILVTHEHDDHADYVQKIAQKSNAIIICHKNLKKRFSKKIDPKDVKGMMPGDQIEIKGISISTFKTTHGKVKIKIWKKEFQFIPHNSPLGFAFSVESNSFMNLGDAIFEPEWRNNPPQIHPDYLMIPAGGIMTMDPYEAAEFIQLIKPKKAVIPCHFQWHILFYRRKVDLSVLQRTCDQNQIAFKPIQPGDMIILD